MKIHQRRNGNWVMVHSGVEAPLSVTYHGLGKFSVFDDDDIEGDTPIARLKDAATCERLALEFMQRNPW
ncbi:hypothetical protein [Labrenzia sp. DG1229]|uniref:hypothetical protein n=1 Tax=Labrenzia sp. DG1229 TaxID=681847 RepID=UPI00048F1F21|nr:hypothetical protein [Labrenzia sp. DG1229]